MASISATDTARLVLAGLARRVPQLVGGDELVFVDVDDTIWEVHGYAKQGAGFGYTGVRGLNALLVTISTPSSAPLITTRMWVTSRPRTRAAFSRPASTTMAVPC